MFASAEWQADTMADSLLMPRFIVENVLSKFTNSEPIKIYGNNTFTARDMMILAIGMITEFDSPSIILKILPFHPCGVCSI